MDILNLQTINVTVMTMSQISLNFNCRHRFNNILYKTTDIKIAASFIHTLLQRQCIFLLAINHNLFECALSTYLSLTIYA